MNAILAALVALPLAVVPALGEDKSEAAKQKGVTVLLRFAKERTVKASCSEANGLITQSMLQLDGVKNVKIDATNNSVRVSYDPGKTTPQKIVGASNKDNPDTLLQSPGAKEAK
jgi:copper chaperone CopZ